MIIFWSYFLLTLKSCTPIQANINWSKVVTMTMLPMVLMATNTHCTTCWNNHKKIMGEHMLDTQHGCICVTCACANLQSLSSVDGPQGPEHSQHSQDFHHIDGAGPEAHMELISRLIRPFKDHTHKQPW